MRRICVILRLAVLIQYRSVTDTHTHPHTHRQTDRQTDRHTTTAYTALSKSSRGKNVTLARRLVGSVGPVDLLGLLAAELGLASLLGLLGLLTLGY